MSHRMVASLAVTAIAFAASAHAQQPPPPGAKACVSIETDSQRLACYDRAMGRPTDTAVGAPHETEPTTKTRTRRQRLFNRDKPAWARSTVAGQSDTGTKPADSISLLDSRWELDEDTKLGTFNIRGYKPVYLMPVFYTTNVNNRPHSPSPDHAADFSQKLDKLEAKFQISFKTKLWQGVFGDTGDLWFGYTQDSHWQVYNDRISRPFRETDYMPEAMLIFDTDYQVAGWTGHLLGIGIAHQSNGRSKPLSRSWNRIIADIGFERPGWTVMFRPWIRINETSAKDDNPDIEDYMGRGSVNIVHVVGHNEFSLMLRHSLRSGDRSHGAVQFTWAFPIHAKLRGYMQIFHGYGESLIDYNHKATYFGLGVSLLGWY
ncbi:MAG TPA: phospholipase A [Oleiagrimonas sp.]|nr:phospholipase A [Oleiagrimonas sp.]